MEKCYNFSTKQDTTHKHMTCLQPTANRVVDNRVCVCTTVIGSRRWGEGTGARARKGRRRRRRDAAGGGGEREAGIWGVGWGVCVGGGGLRPGGGPTPWGPAWRSCPLRSRRSRS